MNYIAYQVTAVGSTQGSTVFGLESAASFQVSVTVTTTSAYAATASGQDGNGGASNLALSIGEKAVEAVAPPYVSGPMQFASATIAPVEVALQDYADWRNGGFTIWDAVNTGLIFGGVIGLVIGLVVAPELVVPMIVVLGFTGDLTNVGL
jgi:hypothetical protein